MSEACSVALRTEGKPEEPAQTSLEKGQGLQQAWAQGRTAGSSGTTSELPHHPAAPAHSVSASLDSGLLFQQRVWFGHLPTRRQREAGCLDGPIRAVTCVGEAAPQDKIRAEGLLSSGRGGWEDAHRPS